MYSKILNLDHVIFEVDFKIVLDAIYSSKSKFYLSNYKYFVTLVCSNDKSDCLSKKKMIKAIVININNYKSKFYLF